MALARKRHVESLRSISNFPHFNFEYTIRGTMMPVSEPAAYQTGTLTKHEKQGF